MRELINQIPQRYRKYIVQEGGAHGAWAVQVGSKFFPLDAKSVFVTGEGKIDIDPIGALQLAEEVSCNETGIEISGASALSDLPRLTVLDLPFAFQWQACGIRSETLRVIVSRYSKANGFDFSHFPSLERADFFGSDLRQLRKIDSARSLRAAGVGDTPLCWLYIRPSLANTVRAIVSLQWHRPDKSVKATIDSARQHGVEFLVDGETLWFPKV